MNESAVKSLIDEKNDFEDDVLADRKPVQCLNDG